MLSCRRDAFPVPLRQDNETGLAVQDTSRIASRDAAGVSWQAFSGGESQMSFDEMEGKAKAGGDNG
jgi:hypothetical protein